MSCSTGRVFFGVSGNWQDATIENLDASAESDQEPLTQVYMESRLKHDNVIELVGYCVEGSPCVPAYEFHTMGSLRDILDGGKGDIEGAEQGQVLSWAQRVKIVVDVANGLRDLHDKAQSNSIHHDISSSNVLLFKDHVAKPVDSDLSNQTPALEARLATFDLGPFAKNAMTGQPDPKSDVYKYGVVMLELLTGRKPIDLTLPKRQQKLVKWFMKSLQSYKETIDCITTINEDLVGQCVDERLGEEYPTRAVAKVAAIAEMCLNPEPLFRPNMNMVASVLEPLLRYNTTVPPADETPSS
ncbi:hypothetical protein MKX01_027493 [Papaver californicum]|nr:hypothetical protein MKX01_027493 [Papaver californicum]